MADYKVLTIVAVKAILPLSELDSGAFIVDDAGFVVGTVLSQEVNPRRSITITTTV